MTEDLGSALAVYASMTGHLIHALVHKGAMEPADGRLIVQQGIDLLRLAPIQGPTTDAAMEGLLALLASIDPAPRGLKRS